MSDNTPKIWKYRLGAFAIDLIFIFLITTIIQNVNPLPVPIWVEYLTPFFSFLAYFLGLSVINKRDYSFGKAALNISIQYSKESNEYDFKRLILRIIILGLIWQLNFQELPSKLFGGDFFEVFGILLFSVQYSFIIYNIFLAILTEKMLQDRLTNTFVKFSPLDSEEHYSPPFEEDVKFYKPMLINSLLVLIIAGSFLTNQIFSESLLFEPTVKFTLEKDVENIIYDELNLRSRVEISVSREWTRNFTNDTSTNNMVLEIDVWIPFIKWNSENRESIINTLNQSLTIDLEKYDQSRLSIWTGYSDFNISREWQVDI